MITALLSGPVDLLLALGLRRTPRLFVLLSPNSFPPLELLLKMRGKEGEGYFIRRKRRDLEKGMF